MVPGAAGLESVLLDLLSRGHTSREHGGHATQANLHHALNLKLTREFPNEPSSESAASTPPASNSANGRRYGSVASIDGAIKNYQIRYHSISSAELTIPTIQLPIPVIGCQWLDRSF